MCICVCLSKGLCITVKCLKRTKGCVGTPVAEVIGGCELPDVVAGSRDICCKGSNSLTAEPSLEL